MCHKVNKVCCAYACGAVLLLFVYLQIEPKFKCNNTNIKGDFHLVVSDLHVHPYERLTDYRMQKVVQQARKQWKIEKTLILGDLMHWAGGLTFSHSNLTMLQWDTMVKRVKFIINDTNAIYVPGNHDLGNVSTHRWNVAFGAYDKQVHLFSNVTAYLASSMKPQPHNLPVVLAHYPIENMHNPLYHQHLKLALNGHKHLIERRAIGGALQYTLPTLNPYQSISNNHFDGSGEQGFALLNSALQVRMCKVYYLWA